MRATRIETRVQRAGGLVTLVAVALLLRGIGGALRRPRGRATGHARRVLRAPVCVVESLLFFMACGWLWRPLPLALSQSGRVLALVLGTPLYIAGLLFVVWGRWALGEMYHVSSGFGVQLHAGHRLVTQGPYARLRHPMYLGVALAGLGGLLLYRTWTFALVTALVPGLQRRARREEQALAAEFGEAWATYCQHVPPWRPRPRGRRDSREG